MVSESFPCLICFGFNERGARIHFSMSYIIYLECITYFSSSACQQNHPGFAVCLGVGACSSSQRNANSSSFSQRTCYWRTVHPATTERAWWGLWGYRSLVGSRTYTKLCDQWQIEPLGPWCLGLFCYQASCWSRGMWWNNPVEWEHLAEQ